MFKVEDAQFREFAKSVKEDFASGTPLKLDVFYRQMFTRLYPEKRTYKVSLCPEVSSLIKGIEERNLQETKEIREFIANFKFYEFEVNNPTLALEEGEPEMNIWQGNTRNGIKLRFGFKDGVSKNISEEELSDNPVHMLLVGVTGSGKSYTLNEITSMLKLEFPPWELKLVLSDAKITTFGHYTQKPYTPHTLAVSATINADYLLSITDYFLQEHRNRMKLFSLMGLEDIKSFRKETGLSLPRILFIGEEFRAQLNSAKRLAPQIVNNFEKIAALTRASGIHICMVSQSPDMGLTGETVKNISLKASLRCKTEESEKVLGEPLAGMFVGHGNIGVVTDSRKKPSGVGAYTYKTPGVSTAQVIKIRESLAKICENIDYPRQSQKMFSDTMIYTKKTFVEQLKSTDRLDDFLLGYCVYLTEFNSDDLQRIKLFGTNSSSNLVFATPIKESKEKLLDLVKSNYMSIEGNKSFDYFINNRTNEVENFCKDIHNSYIAEGKNNLYKVLFNAYIQRAMMYFIDKKSFNNNKIPDNLECIDLFLESKFKEFKVIKDKGNEDDINSKRVELMKTLSKVTLNRINCFEIAANELDTLIRVTYGYEPKHYVKDNLVEIISYMINRQPDTKFIRNSFPRYFLVIDNLATFKFIGVNPKNAMQDAFKLIEEECNTVNMVLIVFMSIYSSDAVSVLKNCRYKIISSTENTSVRCISSTDLEDEDLPENCLILVDNQDGNRPVKKVLMYKL